MSLSPLTCVFIVAVSQRGRVTPTLKPADPTLGPINDFVESVYCDFDTDLCGLIQDKDDDIDYQRNRGSTPTANTGPRADHTSGRGSYLFVESSLPTKVGDRAILRTPWFKRNDRFCIRLSYHMYGQFMGGIRVYAYEKRTGTNVGTPNKIWEKFDDQGNKWNNLQRNYSPRRNVQVRKYFSKAAFIRATFLQRDSKIFYA